MRWVHDLIYLIAALVASPLWLTRMLLTGKIRTDWPARFGRLRPALPPPRRARLLFHAVSVGEVNALRQLIDSLQAGTDVPEIVLATTTDTGLARATQLFADRCTVVRFPLDFSMPISRFVDGIRPDAVILVELEVWPNFALACRKRAIAMGVINGRLTQRSFSRYRLIRPLIRPAFESLAFAAVQNLAYADRFVAMGVPRDHVRVTGTMKWDTAAIADAVPGADELAAAMGIDSSKPLIVAGSTAPGEHELLVKALPAGVQLLCAPRKPEWFDQAAQALPGCARRSRGQRGSSTGRFLLDTIGELRKAYALADLVVVGRSFGNLHGSDMMEPLALGKATIVGPAVEDFRDVVDALLAGDGLVQVQPDHLASAIQQLLDDRTRRSQLAQHGRDVIRAQQGATSRHAAMIRSVIEAKNSPSQG